MRLILSGEGGKMGISNLLGNSRRGSKSIVTDRYKRGGGIKVRQIERYVTVEHSLLNK